MDELVHKLSEGEHPVEVRLRPEATVEAFRESIDRGVVHIRFTDTRGGTELGVRIEPEQCDLSQADFAGKKGKAHLVGSLSLNYVKVQCVADIDLKTLSGSGHLVPQKQEAVA